MPKGFVDLQNNGRMRIDFTEPDLTAEMIRTITLDLAARGTIAYCPTIFTGRIDVYKKNLGLIANLMKDQEVGGHILGIHMEGPFISPEPGAVGAHQKNLVLDPSPDLFNQFQEWAEGNIKILTVAPELPGCETLIRHCAENGVVVSLGHHLAGDEEMERAVKAGAKLCTHLGNGIPNEIHRHNNPLWWQLACDDVSGMFITDGHHLPADFIKVALRAKTVDRFIVTSDASSLSGMPPGQYTFPRGLEVVIEETGRISSPSTGGLAGSHSTMIECMNHLAALNLLTEDELWQVGLENPLRVLGQKPKDLADLNGPEVVFEKGQFVVK